MAADFRTIVGRVQLRCPLASRFLVEDWVRTAFQEIAESKRWSWLYKFTQFMIPAIYNTGTVTVTRNSNVVTGSGTAWTSDMVGRQFRTGTTAPIYTIVSVDSSTQLTLDSVWGASTASAQNYQIYLCFITMPNDFQSFISVWDTNYNWALVTDFTQNQLNAADAQRANTGNAYVLAWRDYTTSSIGVVSQPVQVSGSGNDPGSSGMYTGPNNAVFTVEITTGGAPGTAVFRWKKDSGSYTSGVTTDSGGAAQELQDGVNVYFPTGVSYTLGDIWVINATAGANPGTPRFELWPAQQSEYVYSALYWTKYPDISQSGITIPYTIDSVLIQELALSYAASWPGPSTDRPNPYYRLELSDRHRKQAEYLLHQAERNDSEVFLADTIYQEATALPFAPIPALGDSRWLQAHDI